MSIEPFLHRELVTSSRSGVAFRARSVGVFVILALFAGLTALWDWRKWDRASVGGARDFGLAVYWASLGLILIELLGDAASAAMRIASERDKKTIDVLLATRVPCSEVILGALGAEFVRFLNAMLALVPLLVLSVFLAGVDTRLILVSALGIVATWFSAVALGLLVSVNARTGTRAASTVTAMMFTWLFFPLIAILLKQLLWPNGPSWVLTPPLYVLRTNPIGLLANFSGLARFGGMGEAFAWMIVSELLLGGVCLWGAITRLRPASRTLNDIEIISIHEKLKRVVRAASKRRPRPPCGEDPVFWQTAHGDRLPLGERISGGVAALVLVGMFLVGIQRFCLPAFAELFKYGYGPTPGVKSMPELDPLVLAFISLRYPEMNLKPPQGMARLSFSIAIREFSCGCLLLHIFGLVAQISRSIENERRRETWLGLLATPLSGWEIIRGKIFGGLFLMRQVTITLLVVWLLGLASGSLHPISFVAGLIVLFLVTGFFSLLSFEAVLSGRMKTGGIPTSPVLGPLSLLAWVILLPIGPAIAVFSTLLSYEDVSYLWNTGTILSFKHWFGWKAPTGWILVGAWCLTMAIGSFVVFLQARYLIKHFDFIVGRPTRPRDQPAGAAR